MSDTWDTVRRSFEDALELDPAARAAYLEALTRRDPKLGAEVLSLLEADQDSGEVLGGLSDRIASLEETLAGAGPDLPERIGRFPIQGTLGRGGMGVVYLGLDPKLDRPVAIKMLPSRSRHDPASVAQLHREAKLIAALNHPSIAALHSMEETPEGDSFLVMELVRGESLRRRLAAGSLSPEAVLRLGLHLAGALQAAHELGIVHLDLKPDNVMLTPRDRVKVLDFGIAKNAGAPDTKDPGAARVGTPGYMSPEQIEGRPVDPRSDLFALGCVLFECAAGAPCFPGDSGADRLSRTVRGEVDWSRLADAGGLGELIARCLSVDPEERPESAAAVAVELHRLLGETGTPPPAPEEARHNLPRERTTFVGRTAELERLRALMDRHRLVTLTGPGGSGKTRLALRAAGQRLQHPSGDVRWVDLSPVQGADRVLPLIAGSVPDLAAPEGKEWSVAVLASLLGSRRLTLILDNCEHVLEPVRELAGALLDGCPGVTLVATSREPLALPEERAFSVPPMSLPEPGDDVKKARESDGVHLFRERAIHHRPDFELAEENLGEVIEICRRIDGIPLAIELAAARLRLLSPGQILEMLADRLRLLTGGSTDVKRQETLRDAIRWSYELLDEAEARLFRALSVFAGGWTLEAATAVTGEDEFTLLDGLTGLANKSLIEVGAGGDARPRFRFLETTRQFARELLEDDPEAAALARRHLEVFHALAQEAQPGINGPDFLVWSRRLEAEHDNLLAALRAPAGDDEAAVLLLETGADMMAFWRIRGTMTEARAAMMPVLERARVRTPARARALRSLAGVLHGQGDYEAARPLMVEALSIAEEHENLLEQAAALHGLSILAAETGDLARARELGERCLPLFQELGDDRGTGSTLLNLGLLEAMSGDRERAVPYMQEAVVVLRRVGNLPILTNTLGNLASSLMSLNRGPEAFGHLQEGLEHSRELTLLGEGAYLLTIAASWAADRGEWKTAARFLGGAEGVWESMGAKADPREQAIVESIETGLAAAGAAVRSSARTAREEARSLPFGEAMDAGLAWVRSADPTGS